MVREHAILLDSEAVSSNAMMDAASKSKYREKHSTLQREMNADPNRNRTRAGRLRLGFFLLCMLTLGIIVTMLVSSVSNVKVVRLRMFKSEVALRFGFSPATDLKDNADPIEESEHINTEVVRQATEASKTTTQAPQQTTQAKQPDPKTDKQPAQKEPAPKDSPQKGNPPDQNPQKDKDAKEKDLKDKGEPPKDHADKKGAEKGKDPKESASKDATTKAVAQKDAAPTTAQAKPEAKPSPEVKGAPPTKGPRKRYVIYQCDHTRWCGGLGDRQRGFLSTFVLAQTLNRTFGLNMTTPCNMNQFVQPNEVQWDLDPAELRGLSERAFDTFNHKDQLYPSIINGTIDTLFPEDVIRIKTNGDLLNQILRSPRLTKMLPDWARTGDSSRYHGWKKLAKYSDHIMEHYRDLFKKVKGPEDDKDLICAHVRIARNPTMPNDGDSRFQIRDMEKLWTFVEAYVNNGTYFFLATDSEQVRNIARARFEKMLIDTNGKILHIDRQRGSREACDAFELAILEQYILSHCRTLVISPSNFSHRAREFRGKSDNTFMFTRNGVTKV